MPESLRKPSHAGNSTPEDQRDGEPESTATIIGQESCEKSGQRVEVVKDGTGYDLVSEATPTVAKLAHTVFVCLVGKQENGEGCAKCLAAPEGGREGGRGEMEGGRGREVGRGEMEGERGQRKRGREEREKSRKRRGMKNKEGGEKL